ncbi:hypothetical protein SAMN05518847_104197 [Paenibacillus sp. OV219]|nr:hypothetical protein SAMN05518847_104197 [Paenibacillus sp. OV219]
MKSIPNVSTLGLGGHSLGNVMRALGRRKEAEIMAWTIAPALIKAVSTFRSPMTDCRLTKSELTPGKQKSTRNEVLFFISGIAFFRGERLR